MKQRSFSDKPSLGLVSASAHSEPLLAVAKGWCQASFSRSLWLLGEGVGVAK